MEMDKKAEMKKKKGSITLKKLDIPPKYQMKPALIITATTTMQPPVVGIRMTLGAAQRVSGSLEGKETQAIDKKIKIADMS
uniref:Uncharacterized protein n=1 Tax=Romanomermis culicivorax TaxID=13658 RepID=A0A915JG67_ROMCU